MIKNPIVWRKIQETIDGQVIEGSYAYDPQRGVVEVKTKLAQKATQLEGASPESVARLLLIEIAQEGRRLVTKDELIKFK